MCVTKSFVPSMAHRYGVLKTSTPEILKMTPWLLLLGLLHFTEGQTNGYYSVVAPKVIRPNVPYHVAVSVQGISTPTTVEVKISGREDGGNQYAVRGEVTVPPYTTQMSQLIIGDIGPGQYNLSTKSLSGGFIFQNTTSLEYVRKSYSIFVQTDKAIYKPGHKVQFRVVVLNAYLKPNVKNAINVSVTDGKNHVVKLWQNVVPRNGVFSSELQLSEEPVLGDWTIIVSNLDQNFHKNFHVAEYVLPKFEVTVDVPPHGTFKDAFVVATIRAKYTYGKPVIGKATVTAYPNIYSGVIQPIFQNPVRKVIQIDGKAIVEFDMKNELKLEDDFERTVQIDVDVEEELTGRRQNNSAQVLLHKHKYKMELIKSSEYFKPGLKYTALIKLAYHDDTPVLDDKNLVNVKYGFAVDPEEYVTEKYKISPSGTILLEFYPPISENETLSLGIEAEYLDLKEWFSSVRSSMSPSNTYMQIIVKTEKPKVNEDVVLEINSTSPMKYFTYQVIGRGDVIISKTVTVNLKNTHEVRFLATYAMAPNAHIIVSYIRHDGEVIADVIDVEIDGMLQNFVTLDANPKEAEPGSSIDFKVESKPNSYIGLLGIDQSVLLLRAGNDIDHDNVMTELRSYDAGQSHYSSDVIGRGRRKRSLFWWHGSSTAHEVFDRSGMVILTNGYVYSYTPLLYYRSNFGDELDSVLFAGAAAFSPLEESSMVSEVRVRQHFPETWIWDELEAGSDGKASLKREIPDTITSWVISAFSIDPVYGLGLMDQPMKVRAFRSFFISLDLPYSVIRGEIVAIPVVVFNYLNKDLTVDVTLVNEGLENFDFADISNEVDAQPKLDSYRTKKVFVKSNNGASVSFMITPRKLGYMNLKVTASSSLARDAIEKKLLVKPEGETQYKNKAVLIDLRNTNKYETNVTLEFPQYYVPDSEKISVSAVGDILGPSIPNLSNLIRMPFGCGEQNMLNFVPNIVIINYLRNTRQLTPAVESKALRFLEIGYQQELTYRRDDGSFSAFGNSDSNGSTWLTAFVAKSFRQAMSYITIDERIIQESLQWLANNQAANGSFPEVGKVSHKDMQGGAANGLALTAYTLIAFLENKDIAPQYQNTINKAVHYVASHINGLEDLYALSLSTYALHLADHAFKTVAFNLLETKANTAENMKWWKKPVVDEPDNPWHLLPKSVDIEMTSYTLLTYLQRSLIQDTLPIMNWLIAQRNEEGGFASTQDTVIGIYALAKLAEQMNSDSTSMALTFSNKNVLANIHINSGNLIILQKHEISSKVRELQISASGSGFAIVQISYHYNVNVTGPWPRFTLEPHVDKNSNHNHLQLTICSAFVATNESKESNMAVMEISLPSGFTVDRDALASLRISQNVKRIETKAGDGSVVLYFDKMTQEEYCPTVSAYRTHKVAKQKPVPVTVYDYYDSSRRARMFYQPQVATLCDICEDEDCGDVCSSRSNPQNQGPDVAAGSSELKRTFVGIISVFVMSVLIMQI